MRWIRESSGLGKCCMAVLIGSAAMSLLSGCGKTSYEAVTITKVPYERLEHQTVEVKRGDLKPSVTVTVKVGGYTQKQYGMEKKDLELDTVYVSPGDTVRTGDLLVSFKNENLQNTIEQYTEQKEQDRLMIEHYQRLMQIDAEADYSTDIAMLQEDMQVAGLYVEEAQNRLNSYQIVAQEDGTVIRLNDYLQNGYYVPGKSLLTVMCGNGNYTAETTEPEAFAVGEVYTAQAVGESYQLKLVSVDGNTLTFEPAGDVTGAWDESRLTITVEQEAVKDAVYVNAKAVHEVTDDSDKPVAWYVYVLDEEGFQTPVFVTTGPSIGDSVIITDGLKGGEKVTVE